MNMQNKFISLNISRPGRTKNVVEFYSCIENIQKKIGLGQIQEYYQINKTHFF